VIPVIRLDHAHIFALHIEATMNFYRTMFGARVVYDTELMGRRNVRLDIGGMALHVYDQLPRSADRGLIHHLGICTDDLDGLSLLKMNGLSCNSGRLQTYLIAQLF
jgi:glyoxalase/bleomycin resistance protein/dioxygenase superfamily protein